MSQIKSPIADALRAAIDDRLMSMVYAALDAGLDYYDDPKQQLREWRKLGPYLLAQDLIWSASPEQHEHPNTFVVEPWIAEHLGHCEAGDLTYLVGLWLEKTPLPVRVSADPFEEELKVRRLRNLMVALNR